MTAVTRLSVERYLQNPTEPEGEYINLPFGIRFHGLPTEPALLCIEIFSPSDRLSDCVKSADDSYSGEFLSAGSSILKSELHGKSMQAAII